MNANLTTSLGFILATIISIALAIFAAAWWLAIAIACLAGAAYFWIHDRTYHTLRPRHTTQHPATIGRDFRLTRHHR
jgi:hypothetical protein